MFGREVTKYTVMYGSLFPVLARIIYTHASYTDVHLKVTLPRYVLMPVHRITPK